MIEHYLTCRHEFGGRGPAAFDCWGLVRDVRARVFGWAWLPSYGAIDEGNASGVMEAFESEKARFQLVPPTPGAIATCWRGSKLHVGVVVEIDGRLAVLETNPNTGPRWLTVADFERHYNQVIYYHDR